MFNQSVIRYQLIKEFLILRFLQTNRLIVSVIIGFSVAKRDRYNLTSLGTLKYAYCGWITYLIAGRNPCDRVVKGNLVRQNFPVTNNITLLKVKHIIVMDASFVNTCGK